MSEEQVKSEADQLKKMGLGLVAGFAVPVLVIVLLVQFVVHSQGEAVKDNPALADAAIAKRIAPVGQVVITAAPAAATPAAAGAPAAPAATAPAPATAPAAAEAPAPAAAPASTSPAPVAAAGQKSGEEVYKSVCSACHETGAGGAPKLGDTAAWAPRLKQGLDALTQSALKGKNAMPPKGGNAALSDSEVALAVIFITNKAGSIETPAPKAEKAPAKAEAKPAEKTAAAAPAEAATASGGSDKGKKTFEQTCAPCHATGVAGAPKLGDKAAWGPRIATGKPALYNSALKGKGAMPAKGGNAGLSDDDVKAVVDYMVSQAK
jgi:cytochrome c5